MELSACCLFNSVSRHSISLLHSEPANSGGGGITNWTDTVLEQGEEQARTRLVCPSFPLDRARHS